MIPNDQPLRKETIERMLNHLTEAVATQDETYTTWESNFIDSVYEQFQHKGDLSQKQCEILERLYDK